MENWNQLSEEEKTRLRSATLIAKDDPDALCTPEGWARWLKKCAAYRVKGGEGPDVPHARFYAAAVNGPEEVLFLECERWVDAKKVATILFGGVDVSVELIPEKNMERKPKRYVQVRWVGSAASRVPDNRIQYRHFAGEWKDL